MDIRIQCVVVDAHDCELLARFWSAALGWRITVETDDEWCIEPPEGSPAVDVAPDILFVKVPDAKTVKNRLHLDLRPTDQRSQVQHLVDLGAGASTSASPGTSAGSSWPIPRATNSACWHRCRPIPREPSHAQRSDRRADATVGYVSVPETRTAIPALVGSAASILLMALVASVPASPFLPELAPGMAPSGPFAWLADTLGLDSVHGNALVALGLIAAALGVAAFLVLLRQAWRGRIPLRAVVGLAVAAHVVVVLLPVLFSHDVYSYIAYGRIATVYHANPYVQTPVDFTADPILPLVGYKWVDTPAVYGPLFTGLSALLARWVRSIPAFVTTFRLIAAAASLGTVALIARTTRRERPARAAFAVAAFGLNPVILFQSVGGGHNDLLLALGVAGAFALVLRDLTLPAVAVLALAMMVKASAALPLLLLVVWVVARRPQGTRWRAALTHGGLAALIGAVVAAPFLQTQDPSLGMLELSGHEGWLAPSRLVRRALDFVSGDMLGVIARIGFAAALLICLVALARMLLREHTPAAELGAAWAWSLVLLMLLGPVLLPWYVAWSLPLVWLLPRVPRTVLIGTAAALALSQWTAEPSFYPGAYDANVLIGHYVLTPLVLVWAAWLLIDLRRRCRDGLPLGPEAEAAEVAAAARED